MIKHRYSVYENCSYSVFTAIIQTDILVNILKTPHFLLCSIKKKKSSSVKSAHVLLCFTVLYLNKFFSAQYRENFKFINKIQKPLI